MFYLRIAQLKAHLKIAAAEEFVRLNLRIMTIVGPFLLAVVLPLHFFFNTKELLGAEIWNFPFPKTFV